MVDSWGVTAPLEVTEMSIDLGFAFLGCLIAGSTQKGGLCAVSFGGSDCGGNRL